MNNSNAPLTDLHPKNLASIRAFGLFSVVYTAVHWTLCALLLSGEITYGSKYYTIVVAVLVFGPLVYFPDLYFRLVLLPYAREMKRRGEVTRCAFRRHPYNFGKQVIYCLFLFFLLYFPICVRFVWADYYQDSRYFGSSILYAIFGLPICFYAFYHSIFEWNGRSRK